MSATDIATTVTSAVLELFALYAQEEALRKALRENPPKTPEEFAKRLSELALLADKIAKLASRVGARGSGLSDAEVATLMAGAHSTNQQSWLAPQTSGGEFPYGEILDAYPDESRLVSGDEIYRNEGKYIVRGGIGFRPDPPWSLIKTAP